MTIHIEWSTLGYIAGGMALVGIGVIIGLAWMASKITLWR